MSNTVLLDHLFALVNQLKNLRKQLQEILEIDAPKAQSMGYSPLSLNIGPLKQWIYVIDTHLAANPSLPLSNPSDKEITQYVSYILYLTDQILSDRRFISEIHLEWSYQWQTNAKSTWESVEYSAQRIDAERKHKLTKERLMTALKDKFDMQSPRD